MNNFYDTRRQHSADDLRRLAQANNTQQQSMMNTFGASDMNEIGGDAGQSLEELIMQNNKEIQRRRTYNTQNQAGYPNVGGFGEGADMRRSSMLEFGVSQTPDLDGFQFDPSPLQHAPTPLHNGGGIAQRRQNTQRQRSGSIGHMTLSTQFANMPGDFGPVTQSPVFTQQITKPMDTMSMTDNNNFMNDLSMGLDFGNALDQDMGGDVSAMNMFVNSFPTTMTASPIMPGGQSSNGSGPQMQEKGGSNGTKTSGSDQDVDKVTDAQMSGMVQPDMNGLTTQNAMMGSMAPPPQPLVLQNFSTAPPIQRPNRTLANGPGTMSTFGATSMMELDVQQPNIPQYLNAYSSSGFDMLGILLRVAARPNPQINIGAVDMSCAFVVSDVTQHDCPIVYCSEVFERLTGYSRHEILGRNCRFLQAPDGKVQSGLKRRYVDDQSVLHLKNLIEKRQEAQISLINYRKGGQPFMNLLTLIPVTYDSPEIRYYVGFQVDVVEQPTSITNKNPDGSYAINYQRGMLPRYIFNHPDPNTGRDIELGQTIGRDDVSTVLSTIAAGESELSKRIWDKVLLENTDDVVHVLSLKGLFLYLSPSSRKILEYETQELVGTPLSSVCHPSDIVPVTRELKDTSSGVAVNVVYRIRRKYSGYTWFESHGSLHTEQGKGKKCIILVGRERPVYALARQAIDAAGGIGESEMWTKMSTSGMFLYVPSNAKNLLDRVPSELVGKSAQSLMRQESKIEFGKMLEKARCGMQCTFKHDIQNRRGQTLHAQTTLYPGDAIEGQKPTFLIAQTRLLKMSRNQPTPLHRQLSNVSGSNTDKDSVPSGATPLSKLSPEGGDNSPFRATNATPPTRYNENVHVPVTVSGSSGLPIGNQDLALASEDNVFDELKTTRSTSWQFELRQMEKRNRLLAEELQALVQSKKKRKRRKGMGAMQKDCANCHTRTTPEWRRGPSGNRDLCNSCGLRWAKANGRTSPRTSSHSDKQSGSPTHTSKEMKKSPQTQNVDSHNAKTARMEAGPAEGFGGGIPSKIEEGDEPVEKNSSTA